MAAIETGAESAPKKTKRLEKCFIGPDGTETKQPKADTAIVRVAVIGGAVHDIELAKVQEAGTYHQAACQGLSESIGNAANPSGQAGPAERDERATARIEAILGGEWSSSKDSSGPTKTLLVQALLLVWKEGGKEQPEEVALNLVSGWTPEEKRQWAKNPAVAKAIIKVKDRAAAKPEKADKDSVLGLVG